MNSTTKCLICKSAMEEGFLLDRAESNRRLQQEWWPGAPEPSFWTGIKKPDTCFHVRAMRCVKCGFLMEFATEQVKG